MKLYLILAALWLSAMGVAPAAFAQSDSLIHSDVPLWGPGESGVWPQHLNDDESFGCAHRMRLGVWRFGSADQRAISDTWYRFGNYGLLHCWIDVAEGYEPGRFEIDRPGFLIEIGRAGDAELWALQIGARPGSDYLLLARSTNAGPIDRFDVLQRRCPSGRVRAGRSLDILLTDYCSINTQREMLDLAKRMARLPPLGTLTFEQESHQDE